MKLLPGLKLCACVVAAATLGYFAAYAMAVQCPGGTCSGGSGNDTLHGTSNYDNISGNGGDDNLYGYAWYDELDGGLGGDVAEGGNNRDAVLGGDGWDTVREAQRLSEAPLQPAGMVATIDQTLTDPIHLDRAGLETVGKRFASRILDGAGPALASATWETPGRLRLKFTKRVAGPRRIHGFDLDRTSVLQATQEAATGDILLSIAPVKGGDERSLYYCRGLNPVCELADSNGQALAAFGPIRLDPAPKMK